MSDIDARIKNAAASSSIEEARLCAMAVQMQAAGRLPEAKEACERLLAMSPRHAEGLQLLGVIHAQRGNFSEGAGLLERSVDANPNSAAAWSNLGRMYLELKKFDAAEGAFRRAIALQSNLPQAHMGLGDALTGLGNADAAEASYRRALILNPALAAPHNGLGAALRSFWLYISYRPDSDADFARHPELSELYPRWISNNQLNGGDVPRLYAWILNIKQVMGDGVPGHFAEVGVYRGNSAAVLAHYARRFGRTAYLFDTFEGFDTRDLTGIDANRPEDFKDTSLDLVRGIVGDDAVVYIKGYFPGSIPPGLANEKFSVVNIDCDLYEPIKAGLEYFYPRLSPGGILLLHDYSSCHFDGAKQAIDEFIATVPESLVLLPDKSGTAIVRKNR